MDSVRDVLAGDIMSSPIIAVGLDATIQEISRVMASHDVGSVIVSNKTGYVGIITKMDVVKLVAAGNSPKTTLAKDVMSSPLRKVNVETLIMDVAKKMTHDNIRRVVVQDNKGVVGMISDKDIVAVAPELIELISEKTRIGVV